MTETNTEGFLCNLSPEARALAALEPPPAKYSLADLPGAYRDANGGSVDGAASGVSREGEEE